MNLADIYNDLDIKMPLLPSSNSLQLVENWEGELGLGFPQYFVLDGRELSYLISALPGFAGSPDCFYTDFDGDGIKDMVLPIGGDLTGDGINDFATILDLNGNGIPDADPSGVFYPIGSPDYKRIVNTQTGSSSIIIMSPDGTMSVYDPSGQLTREMYNEAYSLWIKDNGALDKEFNNYTVSEAFLLLAASAAVVYLFSKIFRRRKL